MALKTSYNKDVFETEVAEAFRELYAERNGQMELTGIVGVKTQADVDRLQASLEKERTEHKKTKDRLRPVTFDGLSVVEMSDDQLKTAVEALDGYEELKTKADSAGKLNDEQISQIVEQRIKTRLAPVEREKLQLAEQLKASAEQVTAFQEQERRRTIYDKVREAAVAAKIRPTAFDDALMAAERMFDISEDGRVITKDGVGVTPGVEPDVWFTEMQPKREHWWPESQGGGAKGGKTAQTARATRGQRPIGTSPHRGNTLSSTAWRKRSRWRSLPERPSADRSRWPKLPNKIFRSFNRPTDDRLAKPITAEAGRGAWLPFDSKLEKVTWQVHKFRTSLSRKYSTLTFNN